MAMLLTAAHANAGEIAIARYLTIDEAPSLAQQDPLAAPITAALPASVSRVGEAVEMLLAPSWYRLAPADIAAPERAEFLDLRLPETHRALQPLSLRAALKILAGPAFALVEDPVHRMISFERCADRMEGR